MADIKKIKLGDVTYDIKDASAMRATGTTLGGHSVALGKNTVAGMKAYYYTAINYAAKKIYLSPIKQSTAWNDRNIRPVYSNSITDSSYKDSTFVAPAWSAGDWLGVMNGSHFVFQIQVASVSNNVITYTGELGFNQIPLYTNSWDTEDDSYTVYNLSKPDIGAFTLTHSATATGNGAKAVGSYSFATGKNTIAYNYGVAEGHTTTAGYAGHAEGKETKALGDEGSHAEGRGSEVRGNRGHAEGSFTQAFGWGSHSEGRSLFDDAWASYNKINYSPNLTASDVEAKWRSTKDTDKPLVAFGQGAHAEGGGTAALGDWSHTEGFKTIATGHAAHAEGDETQALHTASHASGYFNKTSADYQTVVGKFNADDSNALFIVGNGTENTRSNAFEVHKDGRTTVGADPTNNMDVATKQYVDNHNYIDNIQDSSKKGAVQQIADGVADGFNFTGKNPNATELDSSLTGTIPYGATGDFASAFGGKSAAIGKRSHAEGTTTIAKGNYSHAEGDNSVALGNDSHAEGYKTTSAGTGSHTEGSATVAQGFYSHAEGAESKAIGDASHAEGGQTTAEAKYSHAEGSATTASGETAHAEGWETTADGHSAHAEGQHTSASGTASHVGGVYSSADGEYSFAHGYDVHAGHNQFVVGYNSASDDDAIFIVGNGVTEFNRSNALVVNNNGTVNIAAEPVSDNDVVNKRYLINNTTRLYLEDQELPDDAPIGSLRVIDTDKFYKHKISLVRSYYDHVMPETSGGYGKQTYEQFYIFAEIINNNPNTLSFTELGNYISDLVVESFYAWDSPDGLATYAAVTELESSGGLTVYYEISGDYPYTDSTYFESSHYNYTDTVTEVI